MLAANDDRDVYLRHAGSLALVAHRRHRRPRGAVARTSPARAHCRRRRAPPPAEPRGRAVRRRQRRDGGARGGSRDQRRRVDRRRRCRRWRDSSTTSDLPPRRYCAAPSTPTSRSARPRPPIASPRSPPIPPARRHACRSGGNAGRVVGAVADGSRRRHLHRPGKAARWVGSAGRRSQADADVERWRAAAQGRPRRSRRSAECAGRRTHPPGAVAGRHVLERPSGVAQGAAGTQGAEHGRGDEGCRCRQRADRPARGPRHPADAVDDRRREGRESRRCDPRRSGQRSAGRVRRAGHAQERGGGESALVVLRRARGRQASAAGATRSRRCDAGQWSPRRCGKLEAYQKSKARRRSRWRSATRCSRAAAPGAVRTRSSRIPPPSARAATPCAMPARMSGPT